MVVEELSWVVVRIKLVSEISFMLVWKGQIYTIKANEPTELPDELVEKILKNKKLSWIKKVE